MRIGKILAWVKADALGLGETTRADLSIEVKAKDGAVLDTATTDTKAFAAGDRLAHTEILSYSYTDGGDGSGAAVTAGTSGTGMGDDSTSFSRTWTIAMSNHKIDIAIGFATSRASGDDYQYADSWVEAEGDIAISRDLGSYLEMTNPNLPADAFDIAIGIAINLPDTAGHFA